MDRIKKRFIPQAYGGSPRNELTPAQRWLDPQAYTKENTLKGSDKVQGKGSEVLGVLNCGGTCGQ